MFSNLQKLQVDVYKLLENSYKKDRLAHAYLFVGDKGTLKEEASKYLSSLLLCENGGGCGECHECTTILNETNPSVFYISPYGQSIKKNQILDLEHEFALMSRKNRIFIIKDIDKATNTSANLLLKFLENIGQNSYGILITENIDNVLPTIKSRCQIVHFKIISRKIIYQNLLNHNIDKDLALAISVITHNIDNAIKLEKDENIYKIIDLAKKIIASFEIGDRFIMIMGTEGKFLFRESREYHDYFLNLLITMQNDKIKFLLKNKNIVFSNFIKEIPIKLDQKVQMQILEIIMDLKKKIRYNLNMELAYLQMLIEIARCING